MRTRGSVATLMAEGDEIRYKDFSRTAGAKTANQHSSCFQSSYTCDPESRAPHRAMLSESCDTYRPLQARLQLDMCPFGVVAWIARGCNDL